MNNMVSPRSSPACGAFTLIELLVVIGIVAVLAALLLPAVSLVKDAARQVGCVNNQRQCMLAIITYADDNEGLTTGADTTGSVPALPGPRHWYSKLMLFDYMGGEWVVGWPAPDGNGVINSPSMRWPNPVGCPVFRPPLNPTGKANPNTSFGIRWNLGWGGPANPERFDSCGVIRLDNLSPTIPYLADTVNVAKTASVTYFAPNSPKSIRLGHRAKAVVSFKDGHSAALGAAALTGECSLTASAMCPVP